jgi:hypothetical protein
MAPRLNVDVYNSSDFQTATARLARALDGVGRAPSFQFQYWREKCFIIGHRPMRKGRSKPGDFNHRTASSERSTPESGLEMSAHINEQ